MAYRGKKIGLSEFEPQTLITHHLATVRITLQRATYEVSSTLSHNVFVQLCGQRPIALTIGEKIDFLAEYSQQCISGALE